MEKAKESLRDREGGREVQFINVDSHEAISNKQDRRIQYSNIVVEGNAK